MKLSYILSIISSFLIGVGVNLATNNGYLAVATFLFCSMLFVKLDRIGEKD